jgi:hypothetical protein
MIVRSSSISMIGMLKKGYRMLKFILLPALLFAATIPVSNGDNLASKINNAVGGDTVLVGDGRLPAATQGGGAYDYE